MLKLDDFVLDVGTLVIVQGLRGALDGKLAHPLEDVDDLVLRAFSGLDHRDAIVGVAHGDTGGALVGLQVGGDAKSGGIVGSLGDAHAAGDLGERAAESVLRLVEVGACAHGSRVGVHGKHSNFPRVVWVWLGSSTAVWVALLSLLVNPRTFGKTGLGNPQKMPFWGVLPLKMTPKRRINICPQLPRQLSEVWACAGGCPNDEGAHRSGPLVGFGTKAPQRAGLSRSWTTGCPREAAGPRT